MTSQKGSAHIAIIVVLVVLLLGALGFIFWQNFFTNDLVESTDVSKQTSASDKLDQKDSAEAEVVKTGTISGKAIYPSEVYPTDYEVCAVNESTKQEVVCDKDMEAGRYSISITPGSYLIVARSGSLEGYYDGYMKSGMTNDICNVSNHTPLAVNVSADSNLENIDAGNFYYSPYNC